MISLVFLHTGLYKKLALTPATKIKFSPTWKLVEQKFSQFMADSDTIMADLRKDGYGSKKPDSNLKKAILMGLILAKDWLVLVGNPPNNLLLLGTLLGVALQYVGAGSELPGAVSLAFSMCSNSSTAKGFNIFLNWQKGIFSYLNFTIIRFVYWKIH